MRSRARGFIGAVATAVAIGTLAHPSAALTGGTVEPTVLSASGQEFIFTYTGKDTSMEVQNLIVEQCIATGAESDFDVDLDCSPLSRQNFFGVNAPDGSVTYGGKLSNPYAPFTGTDEHNGVWSLCTPGSGVTNYQAGFFRLADDPGDEADDAFLPFECAAASSPDTPGGSTPTTPSSASEVPVPALLGAGAGAVLVAGAIVTRRRQRIG